ncbi:unnamed protein product [Owenia fusiformis]|uniref:Winged helix-turn-helix domain-containing protein n=1 Tax=Owenia fusiformis TaxID=6347 RepID=A0A8J1U6W9_OWEFU|nr:unnamed protein product [Owenia fusiformis]
MQDEKIVMTPTKKGNTSCIKIEKVPKFSLDETKVAHQAGGEHSGLVINKKQDESGEARKQDLQLEFKCFLVDAKTGSHVPENRALKFWFQEGTDYLDKVTGAYEFFKELVKPDKFPRDYVGFIKKVMKQLQDAKYTQIKKVDCELTPLASSDEPPPSPGKKVDTRPKEVIMQENLLQILESAYPNILHMEDLVKITGSVEETFIHQQLLVLQEKGLITERENGAWVRKVKDEAAKVQVVNNMPVYHKKEDKPTIAIITSDYYEKLAVDSMIEDKTTFVKYKTEGESNVYTIGFIGPHKVVSTKLPQIGRQRAAQISSGNTTTRLLGSFSEVEHVFLVGVGGGVPHYTDFYKHVRLGDVVCSAPNHKGSCYIYCDKLNMNEETQEITYTLKSWSPPSDIALKLMQTMLEENAANLSNSPWEKFVQEGQEYLQVQEADFSRPLPESDRLYMNIGGSDVIEVGHPPIPDDAEYRPNAPTVRLGTFGAGKPIVKDDAIRLDFAARQNLMAYDDEFDQVMESIVGNRKDSFMFIRGIADYSDGTKGKEWAPYASLVASAAMKAIILRLPTLDSQP